MAEVLLYHHIQGLTDGVRAFADELADSPLGAGAIAGTTLPIDPEVAARDHDAVRGRYYLLDVVYGFVLLDLGDDRNGRAASAHLAARVENVLAIAHEGERDVVDLLLQRELQVAQVLAQVVPDYDRHDRPGDPVEAAGVAADPDAGQRALRVLVEAVGHVHRHRAGDRAHVQDLRRPVFLHAKDVVDPLAEEDRARRPRQAFRRVGGGRLRRRGQRLGQQGRQGVEAPHEPRPVPRPEVADAAQVQRQQLAKRLASTESSYPMGPLEVALLKGVLAAAQAACWNCAGVVGGPSKSIFPACFSSFNQSLL